MPEGVGLADVGHLRALPDRALGGDDEGVVARVGLRGRRRGAGASASRSYGASGMTQRPEVTYAVYSAENPASRPKIRNTPIRSCEPERRPLAVDRLLRPGDRRREPDAVLRALDVVVHGLGDRHERDALVDEHLRVRERVVAPDRHEEVDAERREMVEDERRQVVDALDVGLRDSGPGTCRRARRGRPAARIFRGFVREVCRIVPPVRSMVRVFVAVERPQVVGVEAELRPDVGQALPAATDPEDVVARLGRPVDDALDDGVEAGDVAAAGQDPDALRVLSWRPESYASTVRTMVARGLRRPAAMRRTRRDGRTTRLLASSP